MQYVNRMMKLLLLITIVMLGFQAPAHSEQLNNSVKDCMEHPEKCDETKISPEKNQNQNQADTGSVGLTVWDFIKMLFALIFTVTLLYFLLRFINKKNKVYKSSQLVENLGGTALGGNRSVQILKVGNRLLIVGVGENIQLLKEIDDSNEYSQIISEYNEKMEQLISPSDIVTKVLQKTKNSSASENKGNHFQSVLKQQLQEITKGRKELYEEMEKKGPENR